MIPLISAVVMGVLCPVQAAVAQGVIGHAIQARGESCTKETVVLNQRGHRSDGGSKVRFTKYGQLPDKAREESLWDEGGQSHTCIIVISGSFGWVRTDNITRPMTLGELAACKDGNYRAEVCSLISLTDQNRFAVELLPFVSVGQDTCIGIRVKSPGMPHIDLYFDSNSYLTRKVEMATLISDGSRHASVETLTDYKFLGGKFIATKRSLRIGNGLLTRDEVVEHSATIPVHKVADLFREP